MTIAEAAGGSDVQCSVLRNRAVASGAVQSGRFDVQCYDKDGNLKWSESFPNGTCTIGLNSLLNVGFRSTTQITAWYLGLIDNAGYVSLAAADTMASHSGWAESTAYSETTRPAWSPAAASSGSVANSSTVNFTANATGTMRGVFCCSTNDKGGSTGVLYSHGVFPLGSQAVVNGDVLQMTYTNTLTAS